MKDDDWQPTDDPDEWNGDGTRRGDPTENRLRWRIVRPDGTKIEVDHCGEPFKTRRDAVTAIFAPSAAQLFTCRAMMELTYTIAGWAAIEVDGWKVEPVP